MQIFERSKYTDIPSRQKQQYMTGKKTARTTEQTSKYDHLEKMSTKQLLTNINEEDRLVPAAVRKEIPRIIRLVNAAYDRMKNGGRLFYIGAGTSGRLGIVDASECPPTF